MKAGEDWNVLELALNFGTREWTKASVTILHHGMTRERVRISHSFLILLILSEVGNAGVENKH